MNFRLSSTTSDAFTPSGDRQGVSLCLKSRQLPEHQLALIVAARSSDVETGGVERMKTHGDAGSSNAPGAP